MRVLVILAIAASCSGQIITPYQYVPLAIKYQGVDPFGQTTFGHQSIEQTRHEVRLADGRVVGQFSYIDANGEPAITFFEAGPNGYRVLGSNILPEAPTADLVAPVYNEVGPAPVGYTPEVEQARADFQKAYEAAAAAAAAAPDDVPVAAEPTFAAPETPAAEEPAAPAAEEPAETPAAEEPVRRRREVQRIPLPYIQPVATEYKHTYETTQLEPVKAATPADTTKIELTKKEHEITIPGIKYVQPYAEVKPLQYTVLSPQAGVPFQPYFYSGFPYTFLSPTPAPAVAEE